ncbi:MAG: GDSL-type esterase/lipase family protein [Tannerellaceae bacterium]|nr:GDSL-type esterase/lipase family protein [Tannerellaceae bacterium]
MKSFKYLILPAFLLCHIVCITQEQYIIDHPLHVHIEVDKDWVQRHEADIENFRRQDSEVTDFHCDVLFFGSSSIRLWKTLEEDMSPLRVLNRGYGGSTVRDILYNYRDIFSDYKPSQIVFYCDNDINGGRHDVTIGELYDLYRILFDRLNHDYPGVPVYFLSDKHSRSRANLRETQQIVNNLIRTYAETSKQLVYIDVTTPLLQPDREINDSLYLDDKLHITREAYQLWTNIIKPYLLEKL